MSSSPSAPIQSDTRVELVAISGTIEGARIGLSTTEPLILGRSARGFQIADPLASLQHAQIDWSGDSWLLTDLRSVSGTFVDGVQVTGLPVRIGPGNVIRIGETELEVVQLHQSVRMAVTSLVGGFLALVVFALVAFVLVPRGESSVSLLWTKPIKRGDLRTPSRELALPRPFLRQYGLEARNLRIRRVTDFDENGRDEVWLRHDKKEFVVTFAESGEWLVIGDIPGVCPDEGRSLDGQLNVDFPAVKCPGVTYQMVDGVYRPTQHDGAVVWVRPKREASSTPVEGEPDALEEPSESERTMHDDAPVVPHRLAVRRLERLAGFLGTRGIDEPVHYFLCDGAIPGVDAQLLTERGEQKWLSQGCMRAAYLLGDDLGDVVAVALTEGGRAALVDDISTWLSGNADGIFLSDEDRELVDNWSADPGYLLGSTRLEFREADYYFRPVAAEAQIPKDGRRLLSMRRASDASALAETTTILRAGEMVLDPPGCHELQVNVQGWRCLMSQGCFSARAFLTITDVGCGDPVNVLIANYAGGLSEGASGPLQVRAVLDASTRGDRVEITRARVSYRLVPPSEE